MEWNPIDITSKLWTMNGLIKILVILAWFLWSILIIGGSLFAANAVLEPLNVSIPGLSIIVHWRYFDWSILSLIIVAVFLGLGLAFKSATIEALTVTDKVPEGYIVQTPYPHQPNVNINAPDNKGIIIGNNQGQVNIQAPQQPKLSFSQWQVTKLNDGTFQSIAYVASDIPYVFPRLTFIAKAQSLVSFNAMPDSGVAFGYVQGTVNGGMFVSSANVSCPCTLTAITRNQESITIDLTAWNPLG